MKDDAKSKSIRACLLPAVVAPSSRALATDVVNRRAASRMATKHNAACKLFNVSYRVELRDISQTGARIRIRDGRMPVMGQSVSLRFMDGRNTDARVVWVNAKDAGLSFSVPFGEDFDAQHFDELGADYYRAVLKFQLAR